MKSVLLITYQFRPRPGVGSLRPSGLAKYLPEFGWEATVLTPYLPEGSRPSARVIETEYVDVLEKWKERLGLDSRRGLHEQMGLPTGSTPGEKPFHSRVIDLGKSILAYPDPMKGWVPFALKAIGEVRNKGKFEAIISSAPPASCHIIASRAKRILGCPWIADFRDLWTQNHNYRHTGLHRMLEERLENKTLPAADVLVTVSKPLAACLSTRYPLHAVVPIPNGFDPDEFRPPRPLPRGIFALTYTGQIYPGKQDPTPLFEVLAELIEHGTLPRTTLRVRFYGIAEAWVVALAQRFGLGDVVEFHGVVPRDFVLAKQAESQLLLLLNWTDARYSGIYTGKIFDYLGSRRPILALGGPPGVVSELLAETKAGVHVSTKEQLRRFLIDAYNSYRQCGSVPYTGDEEAINRYTHREMARQFAELLDRVVGVSTG